MASAKEIEEGNQIRLKLNNSGMLPVVTTDANSKEVLMIAYMNQEAFDLSVETGEAHYYSRSRKKIWRKGETSGFIQKIKEIKTDCDQDAIWLSVEMVGGACCHVGYKSCFYRKVVKDSSGGVALEFTESEKKYDPKKIYKK